MKAGTQARLLTRILAVTRAGTAVLTTYSTMLYPASPDVQQLYNIQSPRLGFTLYVTGGQDMRVGDVLTHTDGATVTTLYVVGLAKWDDALEITAEMVK